MAHRGAQAVLGDVNPQEVLEVVRGAASQDPARVKISSDRLKQLEDGCFGTYQTLHEIAGQQSLDLVVRQQSLIQFKNAAITHWKSRK
jgi:hypothetical protein